MSTTSTTQLQFDPGSEEHAPDLYDPAAVAPTYDGLAAVDDAAIASYHEQGYLAVENVLSPVEIQAAMDSMRDLTLGRREGYRGALFEAKAKDKLATLTDEQRLDAIRKLWGFVKYDDVLNALSQHAGMLSVVHRIIGGRSLLLQDMALIKPPHIGREKPWHQDHAYFDLPLDSPVVGVWIALDEATLDNGCMHVLPGRHREGPVPHFLRRDWQICDTTIRGNRSTAVPLKSGGALFFHSLLPHGTPTNHSSLRRRALQYHYCREDAPRITQEQRKSVFGGEGLGMQC